MDLAARVKQLEDSAAAVKERDRAVLQERSHELETAIDDQAGEFKKTTAEAKETARSWWSDTKSAIEGQIAAMRADFEKRQAEFAQKDAAVAITLAGYCVDAAEWAVIRAELARGEADELAVRS